MTSTRRPQARAVRSLHEVLAAARALFAELRVDDVTIDEGPSILYGIDQNGVTLATLTIGPNYPSASEIGLPAQTNPFNPSSGYGEYRTQRLKVGATVCTVNTTSRRVRLDLSPAASTTTVLQTGRPQQPTEDALDLVMAAGGGSSTLYALQGSIGLNAQAGDSGTLADLNVSYRTAVGSDVILRGGAGLTVTNLDMSGGQVELQNGATTVTKSDGTLTLLSTSAVTTLTNRGGTVLDDSSGTITTLTNKGVYLKRGFRAKTITTTYLYAGSRTDDPNGVVTWTNPPELTECRLAAGPDDRGPDVAYVNFGVHKKLTVAAIS